MFANTQRRVRSRAVQEEPQRGTPQTIIGVTDAKFVVIGFHDEQGRHQTLVALEVQGEYYAPRDGVEWTRNVLRPLHSWLGKQVKERRELAAVPIGDSDAVEIMAGPEDTR